MKVDAIAVLTDNYVWALIDEATHHALIIDPGEATPVITFLKQHDLSLQAILITHHHWDHTNGIAEIIAQFPVSVYGPVSENIPHMTHAIMEQASLSLQHFPGTVRVLEIPGHTSGHLAYYVQDKLFCGDTLFAAGCGRLFEGTPTEMYLSLQKILSLPDDTEIYCAHEYTLSNLRFAETVEPGNKKIAERIQRVTALRNKQLPSLPSTLGEEKATNPFLRCDSKEVKENVEKRVGITLQDNVAVFSALRKWKDGF